jgi:para-aminobenzoate synthetase component 1
MWLTAKRPWADPLRLASGIPRAERCWALLYSGLDLGFTGRYSFLALRPEKEIKAQDFAPLAKALATQRAPFENAWFGYLGYGLKDAVEHYPADAPGKFPLPNLWFLLYRLVVVFDHRKKTVQLHAQSRADIAAFDGLAAPALKKIKPPAVARLTSNMTQAEYLKHVETIQDTILKGDLYQANLTRKFSGVWKTAPDAFGLFVTLSKVSPAPYSAFLKLGETFILSSSPERFLTLSKDGRVETRPIKGSAKRGNTAKADAEQREALRRSGKDKAENLMIVDLMRNDLAKACVPGSVKVKNLFHIETYATVHHMSSTVMGRKRKDVSAVDVVRACFPPGSMTGAPKIEAVSLCSALERQARGIYSGAIGWLDSAGTMDLSVVIRTLILQGREFEFQVGGGIVADSVPQEEWKETLVKARAIAKTLGIPLAFLREL